MAHRLSHAALAATLTAVLALAAAAHAENYGQPGWTSPEPNYYAMPTGPDGLTAAMYPAPRPRPRSSARPISLTGRWPRSNSCISTGTAT